MIRSREKVRRLAYDRERARVLTPSRRLSGAVLDRLVVHPPVQLLVLQGLLRVPGCELDRCSD